MTKLAAAFAAFFLFAVPPAAAEAFKPNRVIAVVVRAACAGELYTFVVPTKGAAKLIMALVEGDVTPDQFGLAWRTTQPPQAMPFGAKLHATCGGTAS